MFGFSKSAGLVDRSNGRVGSQVAIPDSVTREDMGGESRRLARIALADIAVLADAVTKALPHVISRGALSLPHVKRLRAAYDGLGEALQRLEAAIET
jgi:hypothetical protein